MEEEDVEAGEGLLSPKPQPSWWFELCYKVWRFYKISLAVIDAIMTYVKVNIVKNQVYGTRPRNTLDVFLPPSSTSGTLKPVVIFLHGGAWSAGDKKLYSPFGKVFSSRGCVVVVPNYTLYPKGKVQHMIEDIALCIRWVEKNIKTFGGDPQNLHFVGHSAGAHLIALYLVKLQTLLHGGEQSLSEAYKGFLKEVEHIPSTLLDTTTTTPTTLSSVFKSFIGIGGPYDIGAHYEHELYRCVEDISAMKPTMGGIDNFHHHSPTTLLASIPFKSRTNKESESESENEKERENDKDDEGKEKEREKESENEKEREKGNEGDQISILPPMYLFHGKEDKTVPPSSSQRFDEELRRSGHRTQLKLYEGIGHADFVVGLMDSSSVFHEFLVEEVLSIIFD